MRVTLDLIMALSHFLKIEQNQGRCIRIHLIHTCDPKFLIEMSPEYDASGNVCNGVIRSVRVQNSWSGDYQKYDELIREAERFFQLSLEETPMRLG